MIVAGEEGKPADDIPILVDPVGNLNPFIFTDRNGD